MKLLKTSLLRIAIIASALMVFISPVSAEEVSDTSLQTDVKTEMETHQIEGEPKAEITCETIEACQKLSALLQKQTEELEAKGVENLTDDEFVHYGELSEKLIATEKQTQKIQKEALATLKQKKREQEKIIKAEKAETADIVKTGQKIAELGSVLSGQ